MYQVYVVSSTLIWMILVASLANTESPVSYPQYGSWLIALLAEGLLLALGLGHGFFVSAFVIVRLTIQASRLLALVALPCLLFSKSSRRTAVTDEESAALLGQTRSSSSNEETLNGALHYGSTGAASSSTNLDYEIKKRKKEEEVREKLKRRLQESGSWFQ